ncbi:MAG: HYC_CC_PP family protein [Crocinitomicaceae bacterium]
MQLIRSMFILSTVLLLLLGSAGIDVFKHICKEDGITVTLFVEAEHHCKEEVQSSCCSGHDEKDCCDDEVELVQILPEYYNDVLTPECIIKIAQETDFYCAEEKFILEEENIFIHPQPPPLSVKRRLSTNQVWII